MTFEEFFQKKKIDLTQLKRARPTLYEEFASHYEQMGEKSFDHTKKYWFNRLRKDYLLNEPTVAQTKAVAAVSTTTSRDFPTATTAPPKEGFKPRFKASVTKATEPLQEAKKTESTTEESAPEEATSTPTTKPLGYKPRFKPGVTNKKND